MMLLAAIIVMHGFPVVYVALRAERHLAPGADTLCSTYLALRAPRLVSSCCSSWRCGSSATRLL